MATDRCARCGAPLDGVVDCPRGFPPGCGLRLAALEPGALTEGPLTEQPLDERARGAALEGAALVGLEVVGLLASPVTIGVAGMVTSLLAMAYAAVRDLDGGRYRIVPRAAGSRVVDAQTGQDATGAQALRRNLPLVLAWSLAVLPDPLGLLGWMAVGFLLAVDAALVLARPDRRRLGDLWAGTIVVQDGVQDGAARAPAAIKPRRGPGDDPRR